MFRYSVKRITTITLIGSGLIISAPTLSVPALALDATGNVNVTASLAESCTVNANNIAFGQLAYGANATVTSSFDVNCLEGTVYTISLDDGDNHDATDGRRMANTAGAQPAYIPYTLHQIDPSIGGAPEIDTNYENTFGIGLPFTGNGAAQEYPLYAYVDGSDTTNKPTGSYSDTVVITVSY